ncbi:hypothetical protein GCM10022389_08040 [Flavobacterium cheonanense]|uniref:Lysozyme inhibitor LprI-like N-terminal domain-containing protein n=1 Tax=Flavobacterium cheonanense TaxID=706183 RepID=A0ABP7VEN5_9FLAO
MKKTLVFYFLIFSFCLNAQTFDEVKACELKYQNCLDSGLDMKTCAITFYNEADVLLNLSYKKLKNQLNASQKRKLQNEQRNWLKKRDKYFEEAFEEAKNDNGGSTLSEDFKMMYFDKKAEFVIERVKELLSKIK